MLPIDDKDLIPYKEATAKLLKALGVDAFGAPDVVVLRGYLVDGALNERKELVTMRLYLDPTCKDFIEMPLDALVKWEPIANSLYPLSGVVAWIKASSRVHYVQTLPASDIADYLEGDMVDGFPQGSDLIGLPKSPRRKRGQVNGSFGGCGSNAAPPVCPS